jgi:hypothetical protein
MRHAIRAPEPPPRPLEDHEREDEDERDEFGELLPDLEEEDAADDGEEDDEAPGTPDAFDLDPPLEDATFEEQTAPDLRFGHDSVLPEAGPDDDTGDASGFAAEPRTGETHPEDSFPADDDEREGMDDLRPFVTVLDLPGLDADEEGMEGDAVRFGAFFAATELAWPSARRAWRVTALATERSSALARSGETVVAGSTDLLWLDRGRTAPVRIALDGTRLVSVALLGDANDTVVAVTAAGRLLRRTRLASDFERIGELGRGLLDVHGVELCALGMSEPRSLLLRTPSGLVERSDDAGSSFVSLEPRLTTAALTSTAAPVVALGDAERELLVSRDRGRSFERTRLEGSAGTVARGDAPFVAASEDTVVLVDPELGLVVSHDAGQSFREVPGTVAATAAAVGSSGGRTYAWVALYSEAADATRILMVDTERGEAEVITTLAGAGDDEQLGSSARIERLVWDGSRLYAAGDPGFLLIEPPNIEAHH